MNPALLGNLCLWLVIKPENWLPHVFLCAAVWHGVAVDKGRADRGMLAPSSYFDFENTKTNWQCTRYEYIFKCHRIMLVGGASYIGEVAFTIKVVCNNTT